MFFIISLDSGRPKSTACQMSFANALIASFANVLRTYSKQLIFTSVCNVYLLANS